MQPILLPNKYVIAALLAALLTGWSALALDMPAVISSSSPVPVGSPSPSPAEPVVRTPARQYGSAYSIKVKLIRGEFDWVVPVWVKPDAKESSFDLSLMRLMGWAENKFEFDEVSLAGMPIGKTKFAQSKSDWAYYPDFAKSCCVGVLGRDVLDQFEIRFDPRNPAHLEWKKLPDDAAASKTKIPLSDLQGIFSLRSTTFKKKKLTETPYTLNLREGELRFDPPKDAGRKTRATPVFQYDFIPPVRTVQVLSIPRDVSASAAKAGLKAGATITKLDRAPISKLDRIELDEILHGRRKDRITLTLSTQKEIDFDFKKNEFIAPQPVPGRSR